MHIIRLLLTATVLALAGCAAPDLDYDPADDMTPIKGSGEKPNVRNRFPEKRGGLPLSPADEEMRTTQPVKQN